MGLLDYTKKWQRELEGGGGGVQGSKTGCGFRRFTDNDHQCHI